MLEECTEHTREPSTWQNAGVTAIHGGSIVTRTITAQQIAADTITANEIAAGTIKHDTMVGVIAGDYIQKSGNSFILNPGKSVKITFNQWVRNEFNQHVDSVSTSITSQVYSDTSLIEVIS